jgi:hypothetical protein
MPPHTKVAEPLQRLDRMRKSFDNDRSVLTVDYKYFITPDAPPTPRVSTPQSKAARKSVEQSAQQSQEQSETPSSDRTDD